MDYSSKDLPIGLLCMAVIIAVHGTYIANGFIWLDHGDIEDGRAIIPLSQWMNAFVTPFAATGFYRPLVTLLHSLDAAIWNSWAPGYHCTNLALHAAAAFAASLFLGCFVPLSRLERWAVVLAFGVHPVAILPTGCISYRSEPLMALFSFIAVWSYANARRDGKIGWFAAIFLSTAFACMAKETAFFYIPSFILLWEFIQIRLSARQQTGATTDHENGSLFGGTVREGTKRWPAVIVAAAALGAVFYLRHHALPLTWRITPVALPPLQGVATRLSVIARHLVNLVSPLPPLFSDAVTIVGVQYLLAGIGAIALGAILLLKFRRRFPFQVMTMAMLIAIELFPALNIVPLPRFFSPHYAYLAVAPAAGAAILLTRTIRRVFRPGIAYGFCLLWLCWGLAAGVSTIRSGKRFKSDLTFFTPEVQKDRRFLEAWFYLGNYHLDNSEYGKAWNDYEQGVQSGPGFIAFVDRPQVLVNQAGAAMQLNDLSSADSVLRLAMDCSPPAWQRVIASNRAFIAGRRGDYGAVIALLAGKEEYLQFPEPCLILADALRHSGQEKEAAEMDKRSIETAATSGKSLFKNMGSLR
jgi:hypothetical protein